MDGGICFPPQHPFTSQVAAHGQLLGPLFPYTLFLPQLHGKHGRLLKGGNPSHEEGRHGPAPLLAQPGQCENGFLSPPSLSALQSLLSLSKTASSTWGHKRQHLLLHLRLPGAIDERDLQAFISGSQRLCTRGISAPFYCYAQP